MSKYRYIFEKGSKKHVCPRCKKKRFVRYVDIETGDYLPERFGKCDRLVNCSYELSPYQDSDWIPQSTFELTPVRKPERAFLPYEVLRQTRAGFEQNNFIQNLLSRVAHPFEVNDVEKVISQYHLGTVKNGYRSGATTFPFIDVKGNICAIQVKQFNDKNHTTGTDFLHSIIEKHHARNRKPLPDWLTAYNNNDTKVSCLFGEHLLSKYPNSPVALVEAPKTAIYGTLYFGFPDNPKNLLWLAVYNLSSLNLKKCSALKGRNVYLFPDLSKDSKAFELWDGKAKEIQSKMQGTRFVVSDLLERYASDTEKEQGKDIADYLIKMDWRTFREKPSVEQPSIPLINQSFSNMGLEVLHVQKFKDPPTEHPNNWESNILELETFFANSIMPTQPVRLDKGVYINNCRLFIASHLDTIKSNIGKDVYRPYLERLFALKESIVAMY